MLDGLINSESKQLQELARDKDEPDMRTPIAQHTHCSAPIAQHTRCSGTSAHPLLRDTRTPVAQGTEAG